MGETNAAEGALTSVVLIGSGTPRLTRICLDAVAQHSGRRWELILVGGNFGDGLGQSVAHARWAAERVEVVVDTGGTGWAAACNRGLRAARGDHLVVLNDAVVVSDGWLDGLVEKAEADPSVGLVGPVSNHASPPQRVELATDEHMGPVHRFAEARRAERRGERFEAERLGGFCLLLTRRAYEDLGGFDENLGPGFCDDDLSIRARAAGFRLAVASDVFVHHFGAWAAGWARPARAWHQIPGMFNFGEVYDIAVDAAADGAVFVEVGCLLGQSTCYLGERIRASGKAITLYAVDTATGSPSDMTGQVLAPALGGSLAGLLHRNILACGLGETVVPILTGSVRASRLFPDGGVDFCFIDGDHSYESVSADLRAWWPKIRPGGTLAGHDYRLPHPWLAGLTPAVHEFFETDDAAHPATPSCWAAVKRA